MSKRDVKVFIVLVSEHSYFRIFHFSAFNLDYGWWNKRAALVYIPILLIFFLLHIAPFIPSYLTIHFTVVRSKHC